MEPFVREGRDERLLGEVRIHNNDATDRQQDGGVNGEDLGVGVQQCLLGVDEGLDGEQVQGGLVDQVHGSEAAELQTMLSATGRPPPEVPDASGVTAALADKARVEGKDAVRREVALDQVGMEREEIKFALEVGPVSGLVEVPVTGKMGEVVMASRAEPEGKEVDEEALLPGPGQVREML